MFKKKLIGEQNGMVSPVQSPKPTLLSREREELAKQQIILTERRNAVLEQEAVVSRVRSNIALMEDHPWLDDLFNVLRFRENATRATGLTI